MASKTHRHHCGTHRRLKFSLSSRSFIFVFPSLKISGHFVFSGPNYCLSLSLFSFISPLRVFSFRPFLLGPNETTS